MGIHRGHVARWRMRRPAGLSRAPGQPALPRAGAPLHRQGYRPVRGGRSPLHLRLGPRLPPRLPAHRAYRQGPSFQRPGHRHHRHRQRPCGGGRGRTTGARPLHQPGGAGQGITPPADHPLERPGRAAGLAGAEPARHARLGHHLLPHRGRLPAGHRVAEGARFRRTRLPCPTRQRGAGGAGGHAPRQPGQSPGGHGGPGHGLRQARPGLRRPLPEAGQHSLILPADRASRASRGPGLRDTAQRPRGRRDPGILHQQRLSRGPGRWNRSSRPSRTPRTG